VKFVPKLSLPKIYPEIGDTINLNCCGDPDCGNYGVAPDFLHQTFVGRNAQAIKQKAFAANPALGKGSLDGPRIFEGSPSVGRREVFGMLSLGG
tara:strand:+ start:264 stop:545 length:282 start_codon:yes stop_codon:yes gene_type:complete